MLQINKHHITYFFILFLTAILFNIYTIAQTIEKTNWPEPVFEHLTIADGLPENSVYSMIQDRFGYMWLGTQNGLVRYDGYDIKVYQRDPGDSLSIRDNTIITIYEDHKGVLWIGTYKGGLNKFDRSNEIFTSYLHNPDDSTSIGSNGVWSINEDKEGKLFIGTDNSLDLFNWQTGSFKRIYKEDDIYVRALIEDTLTGNYYVGINDKIMIYDTENETLEENNNFKIDSELANINSFVQSNDGAIWIGHSKGLAKFNSLRNTIKYYQPEPSLQFIIENDIGQLEDDEKGLIWGGGSWFYESTLGLVCFDTENEQFKFYKSDPNSKYSVSNNQVFSVYKDRSGILWAGNWGGGLNKWDEKKHQFKRFIYDADNRDGERFNTVHTIIEDKAGIIWFGTNNGLYSFNPISNEFLNFKYNTEDNNNLVQHIYIDKSGIIWFGSEMRGLGKFNPVNGSFHFYSNDPNDIRSISNNFVQFIHPGANDILWIGTWGGGLNRFDKKTGIFTRYEHDPDNSQSLSHDEVNSIYIDRRETLWIGTDNGGLNKINHSDESFKSFGLESAILSTYEDRKGNFWIGTFTSGIHLFNRGKEISVYNITEKDGLANNFVKAILEDDYGNLWIGTDQGLSRFNPETRSLKSFLSSESFDGNRYYRNSAFKTSTGEMLFGTYDGFIMFHPDSIKDDPVPPKVVIRNVSLFNRPDEKLEYESFISEIKELNLSYNENDLRFDYVGLHYGDPAKNRYKYMLEGYDKDWVDAGTQRNAVYTNLDAGEYVFRVKACNLDGVWNEEGASLKIIIPPPFWATWWAYSIYFLFFLSLLYSIRRYELNRTQLKNQHKLDEVKLKEREETDKMKSRFFANISHEFRTPLTLIKGPAEKLSSKFQDEEIQKQTGVIKRNANRLLGLINQLLDLSKLEAGKLELKVFKDNVVSFIKGITMSFESIAERKDITLKVKAERDEIELYIDKEKMTKIMTNLLSNAFKFTPEGGQITVIIYEDDNVVRIKVNDTGQGITKEELPKLFDRFYQIDSSQTREHEGTGIGLALTKELVELHHGTISVESKLNEGTEFTIELPVGRSHLKDEEVVEETALTEDVILNPAFDGMKNLNEFHTLDSSSQAPQNDREVNEDKYIVLVIEDNTDVREFIKDSLGNEFQIEEASNGEQGVRKAEQIIPDLIISDIMMPKMDGNELTRILKNDEKTSHIPIILLTAKSEQESKLEGLETGADDYLTKPFDTKELQIRIKNLISIRRKLQERYSKVDFVPGKQTKEKKLSNLEEQFMRKVMEVIEVHFAEENFSIEQFGKEVGMSRVQLHRKLKALSGKSASHYLRSVRLNKAKQMIEEEKGNISEIAYSVGFSSPQYFTRCFKEEFGFSPSDLVR